MITLKPISTTQTISITPRTRQMGSISGFKLFITDEQTNKLIIIDNETEAQDESEYPIQYELVGNYVNLSFEYPFDREDSMYSIEVTYNGELYYRDKIYITSSENTERYHKIVNTDYISRDNDNEYIVYNG